MIHALMFDPDAPSPLALGRRFVVETHERALLTRYGRVVQTLEPGAYRRFGRGYALRRVDVRPFVHTVPTQEIPTADGVTVKVTVAVRARVVDPESYLIANQSALAALHLVVQVALRELVAETTVDDLVRARPHVRDALRDRMSEVSPLGLELDAVEVKDIILPTEIRRAQAQVCSPAPRGRRRSNALGARRPRCAVSPTAPGSLRTTRPCSSSVWCRSSAPARATPWSSERRC